jgi:hypothetical protein
MKQLAIIVLSIVFLCPATAVLAADGSPDSLRAPSVSQCKRKKGKKHSEGGKKKDKKKKKNYGFEL